VGVEVHPQEKGKEDHHPIHSRIRRTVEFRINEFRINEFRIYECRTNERLIDYGYLNICCAGLERELEQYRYQGDEFLLFKFRIDGQMLRRSRFPAAGDRNFDPRSGRSGAGTADSSTLDG